MNNKNPYQDANDLSPIKWMIKNHIKQMIFSFLFFSIFIILPWVGDWYIETNWIRYTVSGSSFIINILSTFLHPYLIWRNVYKLYKSWESIYNK